MGGREIHPGKAVLDYPENIRKRKAGERSKKDVSPGREIFVFRRVVSFRNS
jgi:hypothetical protein